MSDPLDFTPKARKLQPTLLWQNLGVSLVSAVVAFEVVWFQYTQGGEDLATARGATVLGLLAFGGLSIFYGVRAWQAWRSERNWSTVESEFEADSRDTPLS